MHIKMCFTIYYYTKLIGNCSNKSNYDYSDTEVKSIFSAIEVELKIPKNRFQGTDFKDNKFKLG